MSSGQNKEFGDLGEDLAVEFLAKKGYKILDRNWRYRHFELDIVAMDQDNLVVIEVKTRHNSYFENPKDAITPSKQKRIIEATEGFIIEKDIDTETRFDIIEVLIEQDKAPEITHIEDAFSPTW